jgi:chemotaxis protein MotB
MPSPLTRPPLKAPEGHKSGGAWKVAYADFVTAMMALFIVLWMMNASTKVKEAVSGYFKDPRGFASRDGAGSANVGEGLLVGQKNAATVRDEIERALRRMPEFPAIRENVKFSMTGEGLRIDLLETEQGLFFVSGSAEPSAAGERLLKVLGSEFGKMPNPIVLEGHTDSRPFRNTEPTRGYSNWELSTDRAHAARRLFYRYGVHPKQVVEVRGFADEMPLNPADILDARNRRVSVVVKFAPN